MDEDIREAERTYRATDSPEDGEKWIQAVIRTTGLPTKLLIVETIRARRALQAIAYSFSTSSSDHRVEAAYFKAMRKPVTPYDIVAFLRGETEWVSGDHHHAKLAPHVRLCIQPYCEQPATEAGFYPHPVFCKLHSSYLDEECGIAPYYSVADPRCSLPKNHEGPHSWNTA